MQKLSVAANVKPLASLHAKRPAQSQTKSARKRRNSMIHSYTFDGTNIILDIESGAVHVMDGAAFDVVRLFNDLPTSAGRDRLLELADRYELSDLEEAFSEILSLCDEDLLFSKPVHIEYKRPLPVVKALCLHISHDCNLRCGYCFAGTGNFNGARTLMSAETGRKAIDFVIRESGNRKNIEVDFFGGEPLMNFEAVKEIVEYAENAGKKEGKNIRLTLTTNGVLLDDEKLEFVNKHFSNLVLSIDGRKETNDKMRKTLNGGGSYDIILPKLKKAADSRNQDNYYVRGTFTAHNLDFAKDVLHLADMGFRQTSVEPVVGGASSDYSIRESDLPTVFNEYEKLAREYIKEDKTATHFLTFFTLWSIWSRVLVR